MDTNFSDSGVYTLQLQSDGKILVGGKFTTANGAPVSHLVRLNSDGTIDTTFKVDLTFAGQVGGKTIVNALHLDPSGTLFVGGYFDRVNDVPRYCAAALNIGNLETPRPTLRFTANQTSLTIDFDTQPGINYTVESADTIDSANWQPLPNAPHNTGNIQIDISTSSQFFRVVAQP